MTPKDQRMTFGVFNAVHKREIETFCDWWEKCHDRNPRLFPREMTQEEWLEQLSIWLDMGRLEK